MMPSFLSGIAKRIATATTTVVKRGNGAMLGFYVASTTAGTLIFYDATSATNQVTGTITPAVGWHWLPLEFQNLTVVSGGTIDVTIIVSPTL